MLKHGGSLILGAVAVVAPLHLGHMIEITQRPPFARALALTPQPLLVARILEAPLQPRLLRVILRSGQSLAWRAGIYFGLPSSCGICCDVLRGPKNVRRGLHRGGLEMTHDHARSNSGALLGSINITGSNGILCFLGPSPYFRAPFPVSQAIALIGSDALKSSWVIRHAYWLHLGELYSPASCLEAVRRIERESCSRRNAQRDAQASTHVLAA